MTGSPGDPFELVVAEVGAATPVDGPAARWPAGPAKPFSRRVAGCALLVSVLLLTAALGMLVHRSRTVTRTVLTVGPGAHGVDATGCPIRRSCGIIGYPVQPVMDAVLQAFSLTAITGTTTVDADTGTVYRIVARAATDGDVILVQTQCLPGGQQVHSSGPTVRDAGAGETISQTVAGRPGCSASITVHTLTQAAAHVQLLIALAGRLITDADLQLRQ
ncbi:MAG: hypothetical protein ACR2KJ_08455 [Jatrophihabitans sp.]